MEATAKAGNIDDLYALLREDGELLERYDEKAFIDTPLHIAASAGRACFALEILRLKPGFGKKLNPDGLSPLHLALRNGHTFIAKRLIKAEPKLVRVQGREGITPLHCVANSSDDNYIDLLAEFPMACPASVKDLTILGQTALHIAVKNGRLEAFKVLHGWSLCTRNSQVLSWNDGNTP